MTKRKFVNGWTKDLVVAQIKKYNNGTRAVAKNTFDREVCRYQSGNGNRCFIGAFIPDKHRALYSSNQIQGLIDWNSDLANLLPFGNMADLADFQLSHDNADINYNGHTYLALKDFLEGCEE